MTDEHSGLKPRWIELAGGEFWAGSEDFYPDEAPVRSEHVAPFVIAATPITNRQFATFVAATGYLTIAERPLDGPEFEHLAEADRAPGSMVFTPTGSPVNLQDWRQWWRWVPGANWRQPRGPHGPIAEQIPEHPVVQIAYADALAYADWLGARLPTEKELEYAAGGGERPAPYAWGSERDPGGELMANTWRGNFPYRNTGANGWIGTSPVGSFPPNGFGLYDSIGNVWEWTTTPYDRVATASTCACSPDASKSQPAAPGSAPHRRVLKGGSHLCAPEYCLRYRPAARSPQSEDSATTHIGFRVVKDIAVAG